MDYSALLSVDELKDLAQRIVKLTDKEIDLYQELQDQLYLQNPITIYGKNNLTGSVSKEVVQQLMADLNTLRSRGISRDFFLYDISRVLHQIRCIRPEKSNVNIGFIPPPDPPKKPNNGG